jgi:hypothetical protein
MRIQLSPGDWQLLSDYVDGQLSQSQHQRLAERLKNESELRAGLASLRLTTSLLHTAPRRRVPRNFTLSAATVSPRSSQQAGWSLFFRLSSALALVLLVGTFALELLPRSMPAMMNAPAAEKQLQAQDRLAVTSVPTLYPPMPPQQPLPKSPSAPAEGKAGNIQSPAGAGAPPSAPTLVPTTQVQPTQPPPSLMLSAATVESKPSTAVPLPTATQPTADKRTVPARSADAQPTPAATATPASEVSGASAATLEASKRTEQGATPEPTRSRSEAASKTTAPTRPLSEPAHTAQPTRILNTPTSPLPGSSHTTSVPPSAASPADLATARWQTNVGMWLVRSGLLLIALAAGLSAWVLGQKRRK